MHKPSIMLDLYRGECERECPVLYHAGSQYEIGLAGNQCCAPLVAQRKVANSVMFNKENK